MDFKSNSLPEYFSWKDVDGNDYTTPAKDQGRCSSCLFFGIVGCLESVIEIREGLYDLDPDLSEQYLMSCVFLKNLFSTSSFYKSINGTTFESCFPYKASYLVRCSKKEPTWKDYFVPSSEFYLVSNATEEFIKNKIFTHGPVVLPIIAPLWSRFSNGILGLWGRFHNSSDDYYSREIPAPPFRYSNHWILVVGWKDSEDIINGGYWICKNSWGDEWGYDGFFNLEYGSLNSDSGYVGWIDYTADGFNWSK
jgi:hypothetical protein